jgi:very-short-patch-repair endonuclease
MNNGIKTPDYVIQLARDMRKCMTESERLLWNRLKCRQLAGCKFRAQHPIFRYILDFYCDEKHPAIEVDGGVHTNRYEYDNYRDEFLESVGIKTIRFLNNEILKDIDCALHRIIEELK